MSSSSLQLLSHFEQLHTSRSERVRQVLLQFLCDHQLTINEHAQRFYSEVRLPISKDSALFWCCVNARKLLEEHMQDISNSSIFSSGQIHDTDRPVGDQFYLILGFA